MKNTTSNHYRDDLKDLGKKFDDLICQLADEWHPHFKAHKSDFTHAQARRNVYAYMKEHMQDREEFYNNPLIID